MGKRLVTEPTMDVDRGQGQNQAPAPHRGFLEKEIRIE
jgi:hypothetical protein